MKVIDFFNRDPKAPGAWLAQMKLKPGEIVEVAGRQYRYSEDRNGRDRILSPVEVATSGRGDAGGVR